MKRVFSIAAITMLSLVGLQAVVGLQAIAQEETVEPVPVTTNEPTTTESAQPIEITGEYKYVAQPGDSFSVLARKAVQTYGIETQTNLSGAQIIFAETNLSQVNGSPFLNEGQEVVMQRAQVAEWVEKAKTLTDEQKAAWDFYVPFTDFNTNNAGEVRN